MADGVPITIKVRDQVGLISEFRFKTRTEIIKTGQEISFRVKLRTPFQKIFNAYCQKTQRDEQLMKFMFDAQRLRKEETPADHEMEDGDVIDAMIEQVGGC